MAGGLLGLEGLAFAPLGEDAVDDQAARREHDRCDDYAEEEDP